MNSDELNNERLQPQPVNNIEGFEAMSDNNDSNERRRIVIPISDENVIEIIEINSNSNSPIMLDRNTENMEVDLENDSNGINSQNKNIKEPTENSTDEIDEDPGSQCTICYSTYTNSGDHRLCCLKCGHLFGKSCIIHWLKTVPATSRKCPTCNAKASRKDVRILYAKTLIALDTSEKDRLLKKLEILEQEKSRLESMLNNSNSKIRMLQEQVKTFESSIKQIKENPHFHQQMQQTQKNYIFSSKLLMTSKLSERGCRVLALSRNLSLLLATQESINPLFPGYGIRKINIHDMKPIHYQHNLHKKEIRDMAFSYHDRSNLLSVSLDCTAKLYDVQSNVAIQTVIVPEPLWTCSYNFIDSCKFYCGSQKGTIFAFDKRYIHSDPEHIIELSDSKTGIISLCSIPPRPGRFMPNGGILACRLTSIIAIYPCGNSFKNITLPIEGNFLSMQYDDSTDNLLISARPSKNYLTPRHMICQLSKLQCGEPNNYVDILHTFYGARSPKVLSRSSFIPSPFGDRLICAYNERDTTLDTWSLISETKFDNKDIYLPEPILDICSFQNSDEEVTVPCLSDSKLNIIKFSFKSKI